MATFIFRNNTPNTKFCDLAEGEFFVIWKNTTKEVYLKTEPYIDNDTEEYNAVSLATGGIYWVDYTEIVKRYNAIITLKEM